MRASPKAVSDGAAMPHKQNGVWLRLGLLLALLVLTILSIAACTEADKTDALPREISVEKAHQMYQDGVFFLDVRTQEEWEDYHIPNTTLVPLDELGSRLGELPENEEIVVVCRSGNRSQSGRDILLNNGFELATSMSGGLTDWRAKGYPVE